MDLMNILNEVEISKEFSDVEEIMIEFVNETDGLMEELSVDNDEITEQFEFTNSMMVEAVGFNKTANATKKETIKVSDKSPVLSRAALVKKLFDEIEANKAGAVSGKITKAVPIARITFITKGSKSKPGSGGKASEHTVWGLSAQDIATFKGDEGAKKASETKKADGGINIKTKAGGSWRTVYADKITTLYLSSVKKFFKVDSEGSHPAIGERIKKYCKAVAVQKAEAIKDVTKLLNEFGISKKPKAYTAEEIETRLYKQLTSDRSVEAQESDFAELVDAERREAGVAPADEYDYKFDTISFRGGKATVQGSVSTISMVEALGHTVGKNGDKKSFTKKWTENYADIKKEVDSKVPSNFKVNAGWTTANFVG